jgi:hypothetical protein
VNLILTVAGGRTLGTLETNPHIICANRFTTLGTGILGLALTQGTRLIFNWHMLSHRFFYYQESIRGFIFLGSQSSHRVFSWEKGN